MLRNIAKNVSREATPRVRSCIAGAEAPMGSPFAPRIEDSGRDSSKRCPVICGGTWKDSIHYQDEAWASVDNGHSVAKLVNSRKQEVEKSDTIVYTLILNVC